MSSLPELLGNIVAILQASAIFQKIEIVETKVFSPEQFFFKIRAELTPPYLFQIRMYYNHEHTDYAYQLFSGVPLLRWDNKEEFPHLATYPHHHHDADGHVSISALIGNPEHDIKVVLAAVIEFISHSG
jgi:hypothetical protein